MTIAPQGLEVVQQYEDLVRDGRRLSVDSTWQLGDLALTVESRYGESSLKSYADDIGISYPTLMGYRRLSAAYGSRMYERSSLLPSVALILINQPDREELLKLSPTAAEARTLVRDRKAKEAAGDTEPGNVATAPSEDLYGARLKALRRALRDLGGSGLDNGNAAEVAGILERAAKRFRRAGS
jgi:hypothetical protein